MSIDWKAIDEIKANLGEERFDGLTKRCAKELLLGNMDKGGFSYALYECYGVEGHYMHELWAFIETLAKKQLN
jgi:hypothetical protein